MTRTSGDHGGIRRVTEFVLEEVPALVHPEWVDRFPWVVQGTTTRGRGTAPFDLGLFSGGSSGPVVRSNWQDLIRRTGCYAACHQRQVHGADVFLHSSRHRDAIGLAEPPILSEPCDGQVIDEAGVLLTVATADCVPVFLVDPVTETVGALHAGWRGAAAGVLEKGLDGFVGRFDSSIADLHLHLGPAICDACYEVGPEVFEALGQMVPDASRPIDLRGVLAARATKSGVPKEQITISTHCTRCSESNLFSHRGGDACRQVGYIAKRMPMGSRRPDDVT